MQNITKSQVLDTSILHLENFSLILFTRNHVSSPHDVEKRGVGEPKQTIGLRNQRTLMLWELDYSALCWLFTLSLLS